MKIRDNWQAFRQVLRHLRHPVHFLRGLSSALHEELNPGNPWISPDAVDFCKKRLRPDQLGFEWGSGRSTIWFARRVKKLISIEHDPAWFTVVQKRFIQEGIRNVDYRKIPLDPGTDASGAGPKLPRYVAVVNELPDESLDFAIVDGQIRQACIQAVRPKLRKGAFILVDDTHWLPLVDWGIPAEWKLVHQSRVGKTDAEIETTIWEKT